MEGRHFLRVTAASASAGPVTQAAGAATIQCNGDDRVVVPAWNTGSVPGR